MKVPQHRCWGYVPFAALVAAPLFVGELPGGGDELWFIFMIDHAHAMMNSCPRCKRPMKFVRSFPKIGRWPELYIFVCTVCGEVETKEIEQAA